MQLKDSEILDLYQKIADNNVIISYVGMFNFSISNNLLIMFKKHVNNFNIKLVHKKKLYNIMVETLDNVCKHNIHNQQSAQNQNYPGLFLMEKMDNTFIITTGNLVRDEKIKNLQDKLDYTNSLSAEELKEKYKDNIVTGSISESGTAGIGFLDIAIKSGNKLEYSFKKLNNEFHFFTFKIKIGVEKN